MVFGFCSTGVCRTKQVFSGLPEFDSLKVNLSECVLEYFVHRMSRAEKSPALLSSAEGSRTKIKTASPRRVGSAISKARRGNFLTYSIFLKHIVT